jgi:ABC-type sugar transport system ATPase subunit
MIEIAKAISYNADIVIMDEPTSALTPNEVKHLFDMIRKLKERNVAVIYITHKMEEIFQIADEVTVLRDGNHIITEPIEKMTIDSLISAMVGRRLTEMFPKMESKIGDVKMSVRHLEVPGLLHDISFDLRKGEILGVAGLVGAGRTELMEALFGLRQRSAGEILIDGKKTDIRTPADAIKAGIGFLTEDRRLNGIIPVLSVKINTIVANLAHYTKFGVFLNHKKIYKDCEEYKERLKIRTPSLEALIQNLSGGNQQKVVIAREIGRNPELLVAAQPTRGLDVGAIEFVHGQILAERTAGKAVLLISLELEEVLSLADRILVMYEGHIVKEFTGSEADAETLGYYMTGGGGTKLDGSIAPGAPAEGEVGA